MSVHITKTIVTIFLFFACAIFGFAVAFHMLLPQQPAFDNVFAAFLKVLPMMIGEYDFQKNFSWESVAKDNHGSNGTVQVIFVLFIFVVGVVILFHQR